MVAKKKKSPNALAAAAAAVRYVNTSALLPLSLATADAQVVGLHFREAPQTSPTNPFATVAIAQLGAAPLVLHLRSSLNAAQVQAHLRELLADTRVTKVLVDVEFTAPRLRQWLGGGFVKVAGVVDLQLALEVAPRGSALLVLREKCQAASSAFTDAMLKHVQSDPKAWGQPILARPLVLYAASQANMCLEWYTLVAEKERTGVAAAPSLSELKQLTARRWQSASDKAANAKAAVAGGDSTPTALAKKVKATTTPRTTPLIKTSPTPTSLPSCSSVVSSTTNDERNTICVNTTYTYTTAELNKLIQRRGVRLFDPAEVSVVAVHFHIQEHQSQQQQQQLQFNSPPDPPSSSAAGSASPKQPAAPATAAPATAKGGEGGAVGSGAGARATTTRDATRADRPQLLAISMTGLPTAYASAFPGVGGAAALAGDGVAAESETAGAATSNANGATKSAPAASPPLPPLETIVLHLSPALDRSIADSFVASLLEDAALVKVVHGVHAAAFALSESSQLLRPANCVDLQLAYEHVVDASERRASVAKIARHCGVCSDKSKLGYRTAVTSRLEKDPLAWTHQCLARSLLQGLRGETLALLECYSVMLAGGVRSGARGPTAGAGRADSGADSGVAVGDVGATKNPRPKVHATLVPLLARMTARRWDNAIANRGVPSIWFDTAQDYVARSLECLEELLLLQQQSELSSGSASPMSAASSYLPLLLPAPRLECDLAPLLALLPDKFRQPILAIDGFHDKLVDICLDVGRLPHVYVGKGQRISLAVANSSVDGANDAPDASTTDPAALAASGAATVTKADIDEVLANLGGPHKIGFDNRAGIDRQLHRISVMRSKTGEIYGLTMRVGRALEHAANVLQDVLMSSSHRDKSVLLLGRPGSGKTTLIRDVARSIAATRENVCIIDTSNEIGGDGLVPHACVGWARRMMVPSLEEQASVMIECVQNHTVETLVIDEIGRRAEVLAAGTVRQRGPRLIASGHGDFRSLIKNQDLKGLVGGVQQVLVGDAAAAKSPHKGKLQHERAGAPIFDVIVELDHVVRGRCRIIWDVGAAVDAVLCGEGYACEVRQQASEVRGILVPE